MARNRQLQGRPLWFGIFGAAVVASVVGLTTSGWISAKFSQRPVPSTTHLRLMQPFDLYGNLVAPYWPAVTLHGGSCINSSRSADPGSLRCFSGGRAADPCWESGNESHGVDVACLTSPWQTGVLLIVNPNVTAMPGASIAAVPWALEIVQPGRQHQLLECVSAEGPARRVAQLRVNWACFRPGRTQTQALAGYALGFPKVETGKPWTVLYAPAKSTHPVEAMVTFAWR